MIRTKAQSNYELKIRNLNRVEDQTFNPATQLPMIKHYLEKTNYKYYNIRDKQISGVFNYRLTKEEVLNKVRDYKLCSLYESLAEADNNLILQGELEISDKFIVRGSLSTIKNISNRVAMHSPEYHLYNLDLVEEKEPGITGLSKVIDYIVINELFNMVVEFSLFSIPVGVKQENLIIWELRNY